MSDGRSSLDRLAGRPILAFVAHADDCALFIGGTIRLLADAGCPITLVRFTDDCTDSDGLDPSETIRRNDRELQEACEILGIRHRHDLGYPSDTLGDVRRGELREHAIRLIRQVRPYAVLTFDPYARFGEDNQDHIRIAQEVDEAFWTSMFDKHHPEHLQAGLAPHGVVERWYFGRRVTEPTDVIDISAAMPAKTEAAVAHRTMMGNLMRQLTLMGRTAEVDSDWLGGVLGDQDAIVRRMVGHSTTEAFRVVRFSGFAALFDDAPRHRTIPDAARTDAARTDAASTPDASPRPPTSERPDLNGSA
ncbi:MAG: PIG-L family deacetylase [Actinomycetales bacterium]|nr:PIG-L family deacetylase [Actinomycetales bacterium]